MTEHLAATAVCSLSRSEREHIAALPDHANHRIIEGTANASRGPWIDHFGDNFLWSNATLILKGMAPYGVVALEEIDRCCEKLRAREGEPDRGKAWFEEWRALGDLIEKRGDEALAKGRKITAGDYYLRAGIYHYNAERFIAPGPEKKAQCAHAYKVWHQGIRLRHPNVEFIEVPYEGTTLPALFMKAQARRPARRPWSCSTAWTTPRR